jgi:hypothetical protein
MGFLQRFRLKFLGGGVQPQNHDDVGVLDQDDSAVGVVDTMIQAQFMGIITFMVILFTMRLMNQSKYQKALTEGTHVLDLRALNDAVLYKEVFLAYLNAALLEPVLTIGSIPDFQHASQQELIINILTLGSICFWIWLITDAFDYFDVAQMYKYQGELQFEASADPEQYAWLQIRSKEKDAKLERLTLVGSIRRDVALWFVLASISAAWIPGSAITHQDVMHAYAIVILWIVQHHACRRATTWSAGYVVTFLFPSMALMPMEYCMPLMDTFDFVEDLDSVANYRDFVKERTGVDLIIVS